MQKYWDFLKKTLIENKGELSNRGTFRSRFEHTQRVVAWMERLIDSDVDRESLLIATIFHDIGRSDSANASLEHASRGADIFVRFATNNNIDVNVKFISYLIANHSKKELLNEDVPLELKILIEADLLDEEGAMGIIYDAMNVGAKNPTSFRVCYEYIVQHSASILGRSPMVTALGKKFWLEKQQFMIEFLNYIKRDLG